MCGNINKFAGLTGAVLLGTQFIYGTVYGTYGLCPVHGLHFHYYFGSRCIKYKSSPGIGNGHRIIYHTEIVRQDSIYHHIFSIDVQLFRQRIFIIFLRFQLVKIPFVKVQGLGIFHEHSQLLIIQPMYRKLAAAQQFQRSSHLVVQQISVTVKKNQIEKRQYNFVVKGKAV